MVCYFDGQDHPEFTIGTGLSKGTKNIALENLVHAFSRHLLQAG